MKKITLFLALMLSTACSPEPAPTAAPDPQTCPLVADTLDNKHPACCADCTCTVGGDGSPKPRCPMC